MSELGGRSRGNTIPPEPSIGVIFDVDGVIDLHDGIHRSAAEEITTLLREGCNLAYLTNDIRPECLLRADSLIADGIPIVRDNYLTPYYVLEKVMARRGLLSPHYFGSPPPKAYIYLETIPSSPDCIVLGDVSNNLSALDNFIALAHSGLPIFALQRNTLRYEGNYVLPDVGYHIAAWEYCSGRTFELIGKPSLHAYRATLDLLQTRPDKTFMVSDSWSHDLCGTLGIGITPILISGDMDSLLTTSLCTTVQSIKGIASLILGLAKG